MLLLLCCWCGCAFYMCLLLLCGGRPAVAAVRCWCVASCWRCCCAPLLSRLEFAYCCAPGMKDFPEKTWKCLNLVAIRFEPKAVRIDLAIIILISMFYRNGKRRSNFFFPRADFIEIERLFSYVISIFIIYEAFRQISIVFTFILIS